MPVATIDKTKIRNLLSDPNVFATTMIIVLTDFYGPEFFNWAPETIMLETEEDFSFNWPQTNFDRLMAGIALITSDSFYKALPDFIDLCNILSGSPAHPEVFDPADAAECAWGITEALLLAPPDDEEPFSEEIRAYIGKVCEAEGIIVPPDILRIGIVDPNARSNVMANFSEDPELYSAIWQNEADKTDDINQLIKGRLALLIAQIEQLRLKNGDTENVAKKMWQNLNKPQVNDRPIQ